MFREGTFICRLQLAGRYDGTNLGQPWDGIAELGRLRRPEHHWKSDTLSGSADACCCDVVGKLKILIGYGNVRPTQQGHKPIEAGNLCQYVWVKAFSQGA